MANFAPKSAACGLANRAQNQTFRTSSAPATARQEQSFTALAANDRRGPIAEWLLARTKVRKQTFTTCQAKRPPGAQPWCQSRDTEIPARSGAYVVSLRDTN